ncbi:ABC transporter permease [bacterium]|nr:ABC transporter permease [bacterium]
MLLDIIFRELRSTVLSLRLHIALVLTLMVFCIGSAAFVKDYRAGKEISLRYRSEVSKELREAAEQNISRLATMRQHYLFEPSTDTFIDDAKEKYLPNSFEYSAYNVYGFDVSSGAANPYLQEFQELNWMFIVSLIMGFVVFLFTFDAVSGEKEAKTLALAFANSLSRGTLLLGKYISAIIASMLVLFPGICLSLVIVFITGTIAVSGALIIEILVFLAAAGIFVACIAAFGMLVSVVTRSANVSLLLALTCWLIFAAIVPNTALFWAQTLFPIEKAEIIAEKIQKAREEINRNAPPGSWASSSNMPFLPEHELRAANQTNIMNSRKQIWDSYCNDRIRQLQRVRKVTFLSPVSLFEYMSEAVVGGGFVRFEKNWNDLHVFQEQFLGFFKEKDAQDPVSPHWYNPYEDYSTSKKPVNFSEVPLYTEKPATIEERLTRAGLYLAVLVLYAAAAFSLSFMVFVRYDVR